MDRVKLYWVRHGPTHQDRFTGWRDVPADLSDHAALKRLSHHLPADALVISSDLDRAVTTADAIAGTRRRLPHDPNLREFDFGAWDGRHRTDIMADDGDRFRQFWDQPGEITAPGGESWNAVQSRITASIDTLVATHRPRSLVAVAHFGAILTHLTGAAGLTPKEALHHKIDNLSVTELSLDGETWTIQRINHVM